ncbi:hypothetical protein BW33_02529 [Pseudomonas sp. RIT288]|nr:hypothetical protein BW33_02529 [Pseudomonas sp. RIT288]
MLFTYSPQALAENWLNQTFIQILSEGMRRIISGHQVDVWPSVIPVARRSVLRGRSGIRKRLEEFWKEFLTLNLATQEVLLASLNQQSRLPDALFDNSACVEIDRFPDGIRKATIDLFRFLFEEQLTSIKVGAECLRDLHYTAIYDQVPSRVCPFCGLGHFRAPGAPRHALDHYMPITRYPFMGADLRNLPPMCSECNSDFKKNIDILRDRRGRRRRCVDPYNGPFYIVSLAKSLPFAGSVKNGIRLPKWNIQFKGGPQSEAENWDRIFKIRERYQRDVLNAEFRSWLEHFVHWYVRGGHGGGIGDEIAAAIPKYIDTVIQDGLADKAFLKAEVFRMLLRECTNYRRGGEMKAFLEILIANV